MKKKLKPECTVYLVPGIPVDRFPLAGAIYIHHRISGRIYLIKDNGESYESAFDLESLNRVLKPVKIGEL